MPREIKDLQKLIEERAKERLDNDLIELSNAITQNPLMKELPSGNPEQGGFTIHWGTVKETPVYFFYWSNNFMSAIRNFHLPRYIAEESRALLEKVDQLKDQVDELFQVKANRGEAGF